MADERTRTLARDLTLSLLEEGAVGRYVERPDAFDVDEMPIEDQLAIVSITLGHLSTILDDISKHTRDGAAVLNHHREQLMLNMLDSELQQPEDT